MKALYVILIAAAVATLRLAITRSRRRARRDTAQNADGSGGTRRSGPSGTGAARRERFRAATDQSFGDVGMVAMREIRERVRGRIFRVGTLIILLFVGAAIVIPTLHKGSGTTSQTVGIVGDLSSEVSAVVHTAAARNQDHVTVVSLATLSEAKSELRSGKIDVAIVDGDQVLLDQPASSNSSPADSGFVESLAAYLGVLQAYRSAGLTPAQASEVTHARSVPVDTLQPRSSNTTKATSVIGLVLLFFMLTQYCSWILIGVMQEKSSRVVEVLLATLRPIELLGGKVIGIGLVAFGQATLIVVFALVVGQAVGSDLLHGTEPLVLACELLWLILGYAFYCWLYAAAGSTAERQDQVQTLALPLSIPILLGYIFSITVASSGNPSLLFKVLAYLPPTAPFCMPVLVSLDQVAWWQFVASILITLAGTAGVALFAARIYRRAVLQTGSRVRLGELFARSAH
ncbi:MAG: ABC transporter permease [Acidimicrobiales bacterium]